MRSQWCWMSDDLLGEMLLDKSMSDFWNTFLVISPNKKSSYRVRDKLTEAYDRMRHKPPIAKANRSEMKFDNGSAIYFRLSTSLSAGCGLSTNMIVFNDYERIREKDLNALVMALAPSLPVLSGQMLFRLDVPEDRKRLNTQ